MNKVLIAGIGNIFRGDDGFGCEVIKQLLQDPKSSNKKVLIKDFGIRGYDLALEVAKNYSLVVLVDASQRKEPAGTLYHLSIEPGHLENIPIENNHSPCPVQSLALAKTFGAEIKNIHLVACEPASLGDEIFGQEHLSDQVQQAINPAMEMIKGIVKQYA